MVFILMYYFHLSKKKNQDSSILKCLNLEIIIIVDSFHSCDILHISNRGKSLSFKKHLYIIVMILIMVDSVR